MERRSHFWHFQADWTEIEGDMADLVNCGLGGDAVGIRIGFWAKYNFEEVVIVSQIHQGVRFWHF